VSEIAIAFDVPGLDEALALEGRLGAGPEIAKIGLQLYTAAGPGAVRAFRERGRRVFLDLKLHDIPNTVAGAAEQAAKLGAEFLTVHAIGGPPMIRAAVKAAGSATRVLAVTVLTSIDLYSLPPGLESPFIPPWVSSRMLTMAEKAGAYGVVCAAEFLPALRMGRQGRPFFAVTPGIRPEGAARHDQTMVTTAAHAVKLGSSMLVVGRAITHAPDPPAALAALRAERDAALAEAPGPGRSEPAPNAS
jgi:orotidine-5'-phosphate decarboxylase